MLGFVLFKLRNIYNVHIVALGFNADLVINVRCDYGYNVKINTARKHAAVLVVGVVSAYLSSAGGREKAYAVSFGENTAKAVARGGIARAGGAHIAVKH